MQALSRNCRNQSLRWQGRSTSGEDRGAPNDRLLLGMKGTMSEMELSVFRQRSIEAMKQKARRGELFLTVAVGYVKSGSTKSRRTPIGEFRKRSHLHSGSSTSCRRSGRFWCGSGRRRFHFPH